jgi:hypothetical protein
MKVKNGRIRNVNYAGNTAQSTCVDEAAVLSAARQKLPFLNGTMPGTLDRQQGSMTVKWRRIENLFSDDRSW